MIHITEKQTGKILDFIPLGDFWDDNHHRSLKDTLEIFDFKTFGDKRYSEHLAKMNRVIIPDEDGTNTEFVIDNTFKYRNNSTLVTEVYASASYLLLRKAKVIKPQKVVGYTGSQHLGFALSGTEWRPGIVESDNIRTIEIENYTNPYAYIKKIASELNLEIRFRIEDDGQKVIGRYVDLLERVGQWRGREVEFGRDLLGIERKVDDSNIVTALIGLGPEQEDGSRTEVFVEDRDALQRWGIPNPQTGELMHLIETYEPQFTEENPSVERLRELTQNELEKRINSLVEYEGDIADLEKVPGMENKIIRFGDTIKIKDTGFNPPLYLEARIHTQDRSLSDPSQKRITLGDFIEYTEEEVFAAWKSLQARINERLAKMVIVNIVADGGIAFKNGLGSTDLKAVTYLQGQEVDKEGVIYNYLWRVYDKNGNLVDSSVGKQFTVYAKDIDEKATYIVTVSENGNDMSSAVVTVTNVFDGEDGEQGPPGEDGQPTYTWVKYADDDKGNGMSDSPEGKLYIGLAFNKTTPEESNNPADYTWSLMPQNIEIGGRNLVGNFNLYPWGHGNGVIDEFGNTLSYVVKLERHTNYIAHRKTANYNNRFWLIFVDKDTDDPEDLIGESGTIRFRDDNALSYSFNSENYNWLVIYLTNQKNVDDVEKAFVKLEKGNKATDWTPAPEDVQEQIDEAKQDAQNAQQTADGKNTVFYQSTKPSLMGRKEGDLWFKSDEGYKPFRFNGSDFVEASFGHQAIATLDLGKATVGKLSGQFIETKTLEAGHIKSLNGLNIGDGQFVVDKNGNAKFGGHLESASGTFGEVSVKDGDFYLEDTNSDTRYSIVGRTNLIKDHSFELVEVVDPTGQDNIDHNWLDMKDVNEFSNTSWVKVGTPKVAVTGIAGPAHQNARPIFGEKAIVVNSNNYVTQKLWEIAENTKYALSVYTKRSWNNTPGAVRLEVYHISYDSLGNSTRRLLISKNFNPVLSNYEVTRCSISFTTPPLEGSYDEIEIVIRGTNSNWIQCDGVQLVVGDYPSVYNSEDTVWYVIRGDIIIGTSQNILWEGGAFMRGDQTIYPSKRLSECQNGWCFVWSDYSTQSNNWDIVYSFVPKTRYGNHTLFIVPTTEANSNQYTIKALSLFDDRISGLNTNQNGINANNAVLRAVLEY